MLYTFSKIFVVCGLWSTSVLSDITKSNDFDLCAWFVIEQPISLPWLYNDTGREFHKISILLYVEATIIFFSYVNEYKVFNSKRWYPLRITLVYVFWLWILFALQAKFSTKFTLIGLCPIGCASYTLPKAMGDAKVNFTFLI